MIKRTRPIHFIRYTSIQIYIFFPICVQVHVHFGIVIFIYVCLNTRVDRIHPVGSEAIESLRRLNTLCLFLVVFKTSSYVFSKVFEANIRLLGGLLSAHLLMEDDNFPGLGNKSSIPMVPIISEWLCFIHVIISTWYMDDLLFSLLHNCYQSTWLWWHGRPAEPVSRSFNLNV